MLDQLDLKLLHALELDGRAPFSRIGQVLGVSDQTIARRYRRLRAAAGLRVTGMVDDARLGRDSWIVRLGCTLTVAEPLATSLARRPDVQFIDLVSGGTEVVCFLRPRTSRERDELLLDRLQRTPRITSVSAHCVLHSFCGGPSGWLHKTEALTPGEAAALRPSEPTAGAASIVLDAVDEALLAALHADGRATLSELQKATAQPESSVRRRLDRLVSTGALYFAVEYDRRSLGREIAGLCWLTVAPDALDAVGRAVGAHPEVRFAAATTGATNLVLSLFCHTPADLYAYLTAKIGPLDGVRAAETSLTLRRVKALTYPR